MKKKLMRGFTIFSPIATKILAITKDEGEDTMKKQQWVKWLTGVSGALLFTGFVGYIGNQNQVDAGSAAASNQTQQDSSIFENSQNQPRWDFDSDSGTDSGSSTDQGFGPGRDRSYSSGDSGSSSGSGFSDNSSSDSQDSGRMRTRAS